MSEPMAGTVTITLCDYEKLKAQAEGKPVYFARSVAVSEVYSWPEIEDMKRKALRYEDLEFENNKLVADNAELKRENAERGGAYDKVIKENSEQRCRLEYLGRQCESIRQQMTSFQIDADKWRYAMKQLDRNDNGIVADAKLGAMVRNMPMYSTLGPYPSGKWQSSSGVFDTIEEALEALAKE